MRISYPALLLLAGQMASPGLAGTTNRANMAIWDVDLSCGNYFDGSKEDTTGKTGGSNERPYVQDMFNKALRMALAAQGSLKVALQKRPDKAKDETGYNNWIRISEGIIATLGFVPKSDEVESDRDEYWHEVFGIFDKVVDTLQAGENSPSDGYNTRLNAVPGMKPMIVCGENWAWLDKNDPYPGTKTELVSETGVWPWDHRAVGAWYKSHRLLFERTAKQKPILCETDDVQAITHFDYNLIQFCDVVFTDDYKNGWKEPDEIQRGDKLSTVTKNGAVDALHELMHWFGGPELDEDGNASDLEDYVIDDHQAVDEDGNLLYEKPTGEIVKYATSASDRDIMILQLAQSLAYGQRNVWNLAKSHQGTPQEDNSGPAIAIKNADSLAMFAVMMFYDEWNWAHKARARRVGKPIKGQM